jgi:hypothetical protein
MPNVVFYATLQARGRWPKTMQFELDHKFQPPFTALLKTPSRGGFSPMREATMKVNGKQVAAISWPDCSEVRVPVELLGKNTLEFEFDSPEFGSMEVTIQETAVATD